MALAQRDPRQGVRLTSALVSLTVAATSTVLYTLPFDGSTAIIRKLHIFNNNTAPTIVTLGTVVGSTFTQQLPGLYVVNGQDAELTEDELVGYEFTGNIEAQATVAGVAPHTIDLMVEVEVFEGSTVHA